LLALLAVALAVSSLGHESASALTIDPGSTAIHATSPPAQLVLSGVLPAVSAGGSTVVTASDLPADATSVSGLYGTEAANALYAQVADTAASSFESTMASILLDNQISQTAYLASRMRDDVVASQPLSPTRVAVLLVFIITTLAIGIGSSGRFYLEQPDHPMFSKKRRISKRFGAPILRPVVA
jgi:hypothetical protein